VELKKARVLVTGGSEGIGYETAKQLKAAGAEVMICARNKENLKKAATELSVHSYTCDVSDEEQVKKMVAECISVMGSFDVLINNAGFGYFDKLVDQDSKRFQDVMNTNVLGAMLVGRESAKHLVENKSGNIINIASSSGLRGHQSGTAYVATKFALRGMSECWKIELRPFNIRVMMIHPSEVQTSFVTNSEREGRDHNPTIMEASEVAHAIVSVLAMNNVAFVTELAIWSTNPNR
jgi:3-oxoacyl-[acyl-carrier protein] reductase